MSLLLLFLRGTCVTVLFSLSPSLSLDGHALELKRSSSSSVTISPLSMAVILLFIRNVPSYIYLEEEEEQKRTF